MCVARGKGGKSGPTAPSCGKSGKSNGGSGGDCEPEVSDAPSVLIIPEEINIVEIVPAPTPFPTPEATPGSSETVAKGTESDLVPFVEDRED